MSGALRLHEPDFRAGMPGYVLRDWEVVDYGCYELGGTGLWFRGPPPETLETRRYFTVLGAAQTFGCFCVQPYPAKLAERLGMPALNLGYSGAGPTFFLKQSELHEYINSSAFCIVQVMSGRSTSNSRFQNDEGLAHGRRRDTGQATTAEAIFDEAIKGELARFPLPARLSRGVVKLTGLPLPAARRLVYEARANWLRDFRALLAAIEVPTVLFWFSERRPAYTPRYHRQGALLGKFPHLVNASMLAALRPHVGDVVECVSSRGLPQPLVSRFTGERTTVDLGRDLKPVEGGDTSTPIYSGVWHSNMYYPSPEMHEDAAAALEPIGRALVERAASN